ncbi:MAG: DUF1540 domain-containing protein [Lachnospiraceae bacterium]|nr:DUF1540 domain-containing protein [Lachnospiraceae bacterium]
MAYLDCSVRNCTYNKEECCCKGDIMVGGKHAGREDETCCESFRDAKNDRFESALEHPCRTISIDCEAVKCVYNSNYKCIAEHVDIMGAGADESKETSCATFKEK